MTFLRQSLQLSCQNPDSTSRASDQQGVGQWVSGEEARTLGTLPHEARTALPRVHLPSMCRKLREGLTRLARHTACAHRAFWLTGPPRRDAL